jgi:hypothetical protein
MSDVPEVPGGGRWAAAGAVIPNEVYIGGRLSYLRSGEVEKQFIEAVDGHQAIRLLGRSLLTATLTGILFGFMCALWDHDLDEVPMWAVPAILILFFVLLVVPNHELLSEWQLLLDGKAGVADSAYAVIFRVLRDERRIPVNIEARRRVTGPPVRGIRNFLFVHLGRYEMRVSVFAFGADLYLGWTLWRSQTPLTIVFGWLSSLFRGSQGLGGLFDVEPVKALRESVHNALRQGIDAAAAELNVSIVATFGYDIPIEGPQSEIPTTKTSVPTPPSAPSTAH